LLDTISPNISIYVSKRHNIDVGAKKSIIVTNILQAPQVNRKRDNRRENKLQIKSEDNVSPPIERGIIKTDQQNVLIRLGNMHAPNVGLPKIADVGDITTAPPAAHARPYAR